MRKRNAATPERRRMSRINALKLVTTGIFLIDGKAKAEVCS